MKLLIFILAFLTFSLFGQTAPDTFKLKSRIDFSGKAVISHVTPLDDGKKLLLIADKEARIWDVEKGELIKSYPLDFSFGPKGLLNKILRLPQRVLASPDGLKLITLQKASGKYDSAIVWDLATGKQAAVLNGTLDETRSADFSENGKTILTVHGDLKDIEFRFWDADSLALRTSIRINDLGWYRLSDDGEKIFIATGKTKKWLNYLPLDYEPSPNIGLWDTTTGKTTTLFLTGNTSSPTPIDSYPALSPDEKYLAGVSSGKIVVWETGGTGNIKNQISPSGVSDKVNLIGFTSDSRYLMTSEGKYGRLYEVDTGKVAREFRTSGWGYKISPDSHWAIIHDTIGFVSFVDLVDPKHFLGVSLQTAHESSDSANSFSGQEYETESAEISPNSKFIMVNGNHRVSLTETTTGKEFQSLFNPTEVKYKDSGKIKDTGLNNGKAGWVDGGDAIYAVSKDGRSCLIWSIN